VAKKLKPESTNGTSAPTAESNAAPIETAVPVAKKAAKTAAKKAATKKTASRKAPTRKASAPKRKAATPPQEPSDQDISLRAYFIAERRLKLGLAGDQAHDWLEARRQLREEAGLNS
jgi:hypothetical protein